MTRLIAACGLLAGLALPVFGQEAPTEAAPAPRLHELVTVTDELVRIGDLLENAGDIADKPVFRAPDLGHTGTVPLPRIAEAVQKHGLTSFDTAGLTEVIVTRLSRTISAADIRDRIAQVVAGKNGFGQANDLNVTLDRDPRMLHVEATATGELIPARLQVDPRSGRFDITFDLAGSALVRKSPLRFTGVVAETIEAAVLVRPIARGEVLRPSDVSSERRPRAQVTGQAIEAEKAVGMAARQPLQAGQVLRTQDLVKPLVVQRNDPVTIAYEIPGIMLTVRGKALETGAVGDVVSVQNVQSNRTVQATISGPGRVTIAGPASPRVTVASSEQSAPQSAE